MEGGYGNELTTVGYVMTPEQELREQKLGCGLESFFDLARPVLVLLQDR